MNVAAHSTTLLSFVTTLTIVTASLSIVFVITMWVIIGRKDRHMQRGRPVADVSEVPSAGDQGGRQRAERDSALRVRAINLRETVRQAVDEDPDVPRGAKLAGRWVLIFVLTVAPVVVGIIIWLTTH